MKKQKTPLQKEKEKVKKLKKENIDILTDNKKIKQSLLIRDTKITELTRQLDQQISLTEQKESERAKLFNSDLDNKYEIDVLNKSIVNLIKKLNN